MPEFRRNPITGDWVLYAAGRAARPNDFRAGQQSADCPFCPGNEGLTPPEVLAARPEDSAADSPGWRWRVIPNKFPALVAEEAGTVSSATGVNWRPGTGRHEVVIETPRHGAGLADLDCGEITAALGACQVRIAALHRDPGVRYVLIFKNHGQGAGASLRHPHFQIAGLPFVPDRIQSQLDHARADFEGNGSCAFCDLIATERRDGARLIHLDDDIAVFAPYAGRFPGETWIMPRRHAARFDESPSHVLGATAAALRNLVVALNSWKGETPYNLVIHTAPAGVDCDQHYHWRIEIIPRLSGVAGFEWATGVHVNQVAPEEAARRYRENWRG